MFNESAPCTGSNGIGVEQRSAHSTVRRTGLGYPEAWVGNPFSPHAPGSQLAQPASGHTFLRSCPWTSGAGPQGKGWISAGFHNSHAHTAGPPHSPPPEVQVQHLPSERSEATMGHGGGRGACVCVGGGPAHLSWIPTTPPENSEHKGLIQGAPMLLERSQRPWGVGR